jgi:hypothetical protein
MRFPATEPGDTEGGLSTSVTLELGCYGTTVRMVNLYNHDRVLIGDGLAQRAARYEQVMGLPAAWDASGGFVPPFNVQCERLVVEPDRIRGWVVMDSHMRILPGDEERRRYDRHRRVYGPRKCFRFDINAERKGETWTGTWTVQNVVYHRCAETPAPAWESPGALDKPLEIVCEPYAAIKARGALDPEKDWAVNGGPYGNWTAIPCGKPLFTDYSQLRLLWRSEEWAPVGWTGGAIQKCYHLAGGYAPPIVHRGNVYLFTFFPSGSKLSTARNTDRDPKLSGPAHFKNYFPEKWLLEADDVCVCIDGATGMTRWRRIFPGKAVNAFKSSHGWCVPCAADGKVFFLGAGGMIYALNADTGETVWMKPSRLVGRTEKSKAKWRSEEEPKGGNADRVHHGLTVSGKTLLAVGQAYNVDTGKALWSTKSRDRFMPSPWRVDGIDCFLTYFGSAGTAAVRADTGETLWTAPGVSCMPAHTEDRLITMMPPEQRQTGRVPACYAIDASGATLLWKGSETYQLNYADPQIHGGRVFFVSYKGGRDKSPGMSIHDLLTGKKLQKIPYRAEYWGAATDNRLYRPGMRWFSLDGPDVVPVGAKRSKRQRCRYAPFIGTCIPPAIADGRVVYRSRNAVYCLDLRAPSAVTNPK